MKKPKNKSERSEYGWNKRDRPVVVLEPGKSHRAVDKIGTILRAHYRKRKIFQRAGELVRIFCVPVGHIDRGLKIPQGTMQLQSLTKTALADDFSRIATFEKITDGHTKRVDCPPNIAGIYLSRTGKWRVPVLEGICTAPVLGPNGTVLQKRGFDKETKLWLECEGDWPTIPDRPTRDDALKALETLRLPFAEFPWVSDADFSVHLACILTAIQRRLLPACPIFGYSAPAPRTGKSLLSELVGIIATGTKPSATAFSGEREETRKAILSTLRAGHLITNIDNVTDGQPLSSPDLARAITQPRYQDRILGQSLMLSFPTNVLWTATGNNLAFRGDLSVRALICTIDARMEHPETRKFKKSQDELENHVSRTRKELITAALTILRAYQVAGRPRMGIQNWGGFEVWSRTIREPLVWLGIADPCDTRKNVLADDPERQEAKEVLRWLSEMFGNDEFTTNKLIARCAGNHGLRIAVTAVAGAGPQKEIDSRKLGNWLQKNKGRVINGLFVEKGTGTTGGAARYRIRQQRGSEGSPGGRFPGVQRFPRLRK